MGFSYTSLAYLITHRVYAYPFVGILPIQATNFKRLCAIQHSLPYRQNRFPEIDHRLLGFVLKTDSCQTYPKGKKTLMTTVRTAGGPSDLSHERLYRR
jgi:hypothetical protein